MQCNHSILKSTERIIELKRFFSKSHFLVSENGLTSSKIMGSSASKDPGRENKHQYKLGLSGTLAANINKWFAKDRARELLWLASNIGQTQCSSDKRILKKRSRIYSVVVLFTNHELISFTLKTTMIEIV